METLTKHGRQAICNSFGIMDNKSIFIREKEAFIDRMNLLYPYKDTITRVSNYKRDLERFDSEQSLNKYLKEVTDNLYKKFDETIILADKLERKLGKPIQDGMCTSDFNARDSEEDRYMLRISYVYPVYSALEYLLSPVMKLPLDFGEFIFTLTNSYFLANTKDLYIERFSKEAQKILRRSMKELSMIMMSLISPKFITTKELVSMGLADVKYITSENRSVKSLNDIVNTLDNDHVIKGNCFVELYKSFRPFEGYNIICNLTKFPAVNTKFYYIEHYDEYLLPYYLRKVKCEEISKYDKYYNAGIYEAKLLRDIEITGELYDCC